MGYNSVVNIMVSSFVWPLLTPKFAIYVKFRQNLTLQQFRVTQGHRSWCQSKAHM